MKMKLQFLFMAALLFVALPYHAQAVSKRIEVPTAGPSSASTAHVADVKHLRFGEKLAVKIAKHKQKKEARHMAHAVKPGKGGKSQIVALILCIFLGVLGVHRFYLGYTGIGILYLFTAGLFGIGWLIDTILLIIPRGLTPKGDQNYRG